MRRESSQSCSVLARRMPGQPSSGSASSAVEASKAEVTEPLTAQVLAGFAGSWLGSSWAPRTVCVCEASGVDRTVLEVLREQLQRCGPEHLAGARDLPGLTLTYAALSFVCGLLAGVVLAVLVLRRLSCLQS